MKSLANCKPTEFLRQTNLIRKAVSKWLTDTDIMNIRRRVPAFVVAKPGSSAEERAAVVKQNADLQRKQIRDNMSAILDAMLDQYPEETLEILALCCFVDLAHVDDYPISEYLSAITSILSDEAVLGFFTSLAKLGQTNTFKA